MKTSIFILNILAWMSYFFVFIAKKNGILLPYFFQCYFADLLAIPLVLGLTTFLLKKATKNANFKLSPLMIVVACIYFSVFFEWILPSFSASYTRDLMDVICYFTGGCIFYFISQYSSVNRIDYVTTVR